MIEVLATVGGLLLLAVGGGAWLFVRSVDAEEYNPDPTLQAIGRGLLWESDPARCCSEQIRSKLEAGTPDREDGGRAKPPEITTVVQDPEEVEEEGPPRLKGQHVTGPEGD